MIDRIANAPAIVRGALWMLLTGFGFAIVPVAVRAMTDTIPVFEIVFLRNLAALLPAVSSASPPPTTLTATASTSLPHPLMPPSTAVLSLSIPV